MKKKKNPNQSQCLLSNIFKRYISIEKKTVAEHRHVKNVLHPVYIRLNVLLFSYRHPARTSQTCNAANWKSLRCFPPPLSSITMKWLSREWGRNTRRKRCFRLAKRSVASAAGCSWRSGCVPVLFTADHSQNAAEYTRCCSASGEEQRRGQSQWFRVKEERSCLLSSSHPSHIRTQLFMWRARSMAMAGRVFKKKRGRGGSFFYISIFFFLFAKSVMWCKIELPSALLAALFWGSHLSVIRKQDFWFSWSNIGLKKEAVWTGNWHELWVPKFERIMAAGTHASDRSDWKQAETLVTVSIWLLVYVAGHF